MPTEVRCIACETVIRPAPAGVLRPIVILGECPDCRDRLIAELARLREMAAGLLVTPGV